MTRVQMCFRQSEIARRESSITCVFIQLLIHAKRAHKSTVSCTYIDLIMENLMESSDRSHLTNSSTQQFPSPKSPKLTILTPECQRYTICKTFASSYLTDWPRGTYSVKELVQKCFYLKSKPRNKAG